MGALQAMMDSFKLEMRAMIAESRSKSSSPAPQQPSPPSSNQAPPQSDSPATVTQQQPSLAKKKRNERTRQQYKRKKALHVTVQPSVKEVEHTVRVEHGNKHSEHVMLQRIESISWGWD